MQHTFRTKHNIQSKTPNMTFTQKHCVVKMTTSLCPCYSRRIENIPRCVFDILTASQWPSGLVERGFRGCGASVTYHAETTIF
jgi:hypothetical protein